MPSKYADAVFSSALPSSDEDEDQDDVADEESSDSTLGADVRKAWKAGDDAALAKAIRAIRST